MVDRYTLAVETFEPEIRKMSNSHWMCPKRCANRNRVGNHKREAQKLNQCKGKYNCFKKERFWAMIIATTQALVPTPKRSLSELCFQILAENTILFCRGLYWLEKEIISNYTRNAIRLGLHDANDFWMVLLAIFYT